MEIIGWSGRWPTDEYPPDGTKIKYLYKKGEVKESIIKYIWCGEEPVIELEDGNRIFVSLDKCEFLK